MAIATFKTELDKAKAEIEGKDNAIANLETQISGVVAGNNDQVSTIAELETKLSGVMAELLEREQAIATLKSELERAAGDKQLNLFPPEPEPEPEPTPEPEPVTASPAVTGTFPKRELAKHILEKFPDSDLGKTKDFEKIYNAIGDAVRDKDKKAKGKEFSRLFYLERDYGFKFLGKIGKENRFKLI